MKTTLDQFKTQLSTLLRDLIPCTAADLTDSAIAYWDGHRVVYCYLDENDLIDAEFDLDVGLWKEWQDYLSEWMAAPLFSVRPELGDLLKDSPPNEAG
ncbi:hypothetical protein ABH945_007171 [Paraburkholderia sp. GAS333]|uniref:hypothetical protein n=1 Tax=Paraburkholderia sp. GAS333 TaxID=3156279 RepID=UPI003D24CB0C